MTTLMKTLWIAVPLALVGCKKTKAPEPTEGSGPVNQGSGAAVAPGSAADPHGTAGSAGSAMGSGSAVTDTGSGSAAAPAGDHLVIKDAGFMTPESVLYDADTDLYLVSNINGAPTVTDDNGFISKVGPDGKVVELKWIDGAKDDVKLDAPKGSAIVGGVLYVADITVVRKFDAKTGKAKGDIKIAGATFLNDIAPADGGGVYVTDTGVDPKFAPNGTDAVYKIGADDKVTTVLKNKDLGSPNGIAAVGNSVWIATFGTGEVYEINAKGEKQPGAKLPTGQLDGILAREGGEWLVSSWGGKTVYSGKPGEWKDLKLDLAAPADIGWDSKRKKLLVPQFQDNAVHVIGL
ncbi:MAG: hypothetical protein H0T79_06095 [Deltaproteobacteria bacterium]|nr:hypothetical protein [Deltaproteobacteria bacterium]